MIKKMMIPFLAIYASLFAAPEAIVFDFGGVMTKEPNREAVVQFLLKSFELNPKEFETIKQERKQAIESGKRDQDFWLEYAQKKNISLPKDWEITFNKVMKDAIGINDQMYNFVLELKKKGIPIALLSNIDNRSARIIREFDLYAPFDPCFLSCEIGLEKPDPRIYEFLINEMQLPSCNIIFIDDELENVEAAKKIGLDAIIFTSQTQLEKELQKRDI